jgi:hypothetical protein
MAASMERAGGKFKRNGMCFCEPRQKALILAAVWPNPPFI